MNLNLFTTKYIRLILQRLVMVMHEGSEVTSETRQRSQPAGSKRRQMNNYIS